MSLFSKIWVFIIWFGFFSCKESEVEFSANNCKKNPAFIRSIGYDPAASSFSTSDEGVMGLVLQQSEQPGNTESGTVKKFQHSSWKKAGWLAPILIDSKGDIYVAPAPFISVLYNKASDQNKIYRVDRTTGIMDVFLKLPLTDSSNIQNPFGIIGMVLLCETNTLYVSTISGSDRLHERGCIYAIDLDSKRIIDEIAGTDAMGMGITYITGQRKLFFGTGRSSDVFSVTLTGKGKFSGSPKKEFSLVGLGSAGDDRVRRIRTDQYGNLIIHGMEFNYNLIPAREKKETVYKFYYETSTQAWILK